MPTRRRHGAPSTPDARSPRHSARSRRIGAVLASLFVLAAVAVAPQLGADVPIAGVPEGLALTPSGTLKVYEDNAVIDSLHVDGMVYVFADNVTIKNTLVRASSWYGVRVMPGSTGLVIEDSTVECTQPSGTGVAFGDYTATRVAVNGCKNSFLHMSSPSVKVIASAVNGEAFGDADGSAAPAPAPAPGAETLPPPTAAPTTAPPVTAAPTTVAPTTAPPTTAAPAPTTTAPPVTAPPTTAPPTTVPGTTSTGHPTFASTGPRSGVALTSSGSLTVTTDGAVIENREVKGSITVEANNVTIRNVRVLGTAATAIHLRRGYENLTMERIEIIGQFTSGQVAIADQGIYGEGSWTLRNSRISGYPDGAKLHSDQVVEGNYFFGNVRTIDSAGRQKHTDGMQSMGGTNVVIRNNTFVSDQKSNNTMGSDLMIQNDFSAVSDYLIERNNFSGGNFTVYFTDKLNGAAQHQDVVVRDNVFAKNTWQYGPVYLRGTNMDVRFSGNTYNDGTALNR